MSPSTPTLPLAQRPQTSSTPSCPPSSGTQVPLTPHRAPRPRPPSTNCNRPSRAPHGLQSRSTPSPITSPRRNNRIPLLNRRDYPYPNRRLPQPPTHPPPPPLSPTLPRSFHVLLRTLPSISHTLRPTLRRPCPHGIPAIPQQQWAAFAHPQKTLASIPSSLPHTHRPRRRARPPRAARTTFPFVVFFGSRSRQLNIISAAQRHSPVRLHRGLSLPHETSSHPVRTSLCAQA